MNGRLETPYILLPANDLEYALTEAQRGAMSINDFIEVLLGSDVAIPSGTEAMTDMNELQPLFFERRGCQMMACMSHLDRAQIYVDMAPYCLVTKGHDLIQRLLPDLGLVINPGFNVGLELTPAGLKNIRRDFGL